MVKVIRDDEEDGEILSKEELTDFRMWNELRKRKDPDFKRTERLLDDEPDLHEIVDGKKASVWVWKQVGAIAKWVGVVIGAIVAWKAYFAVGGKS